MENIIPVLIVVGGLIYKIYQNYQKEMEEARKRQQNMKRVPNPAPAVDIQPKPVVPVAPPTHNQKLGRPKPQKLVITQQQQELDMEPLKKTSLETPQIDWPEEVGRIRKASKIDEHKIKRLEIEETEELLPAAEEKIVFDLRQAVVQSAILERPYKG